MHKSLILCSFIFSLLGGVQGTPAVTVKELKDTKRAKYIRVHNRMHLELPIFPIASSQNSTWADPIIPETFILQIPKGRVYSSNGIVLVDGQLVKELIWPWSALKKDEKTFNLE